MGTRLQINRLVLACRGLMNHGPSKPPKEHGIDSILEESGVKIKKGPFYNADPTGQRTGNRCDPKLGAVIEKTCTDALQAISSKQVTMRVALTPELLKEKNSQYRWCCNHCISDGSSRLGPSAA